MSSITTEKKPAQGDIVRIRTRTYLVEAARQTLDGLVVSGSCLDDDAQGQSLEVIWELELNTEILSDDLWKTVGQRGFDRPRYFSAYLNALKWNCVTATNPRLFQSPFRAGIRIDAYQLEPLQKALQLPRVNMFIADDVGLGKTIEAGLIASELLLRRRVQDIVVACPPSMLSQWKDELESRFGLTFEVLDRAYIEKVRQERGYGVNPWTTFPRFLVSQRLLIDENYAAPMRDWLDNLRPGSLLILDEAHHAAPSSGAKYAIDTRITRAIRDLAPRFEHRLFLSATPHNGHSNSFSALLEILDSNRFSRGIPVLKGHLNHVMVRRLKDDIRELVGGFPKREVVQLDIDGLPDSAPELRLSRLLDEYRNVRQRRVEGETKKKQATAALLITGLQNRLLSSIEAFYRTLKKHKQTMERYWEKETSGDGSSNGKPPAEVASARQIKLLTQSPDRDTDTSQLSEAELGEMEDAQVEAATTASMGNSSVADIQREKDLLEEMEGIAEQARGKPDAKVRRLIQWIRDNMCAGVHEPGQRSSDTDGKWSDQRLLIFTEWEDSKRYLVNCLKSAVTGTDLAEQRIQIFHGPTPPDKREQIKRDFNAHPDKHPVRILVATDAAREGLNLQAHCYQLFHFDVPWNPSRLEQRNGRIDRKLQPAPEVFCHYFVYLQRPEDIVLTALVRKTKTIRQELGSLSAVLESRLEDSLKFGIKHDQAKALAEEIEGAAVDEDKRQANEEELEVTRTRQDQLAKDITQLERRVEDARKWIGLDNDSLRDALSCSLEMLGSTPLSIAATPDGEPARFEFPNLELRQGGDPTWVTTIDTLRAPPEEGVKEYQWRKDAKVRPVVFEPPETIDDDVVQLHLHHRVVQRLLGRFLSQGFVNHDLSRACLAQSEDSIPRVVLLGRLSLYGPGASRLHEEILSVTARWIEPARRTGSLTPYAREAETKTLELLSSSLRPGKQQEVQESVQQQFLDSISLDIEQLMPQLRQRGLDSQADAVKLLTARGQAEAESMRQVLENQKQRIQTELDKPEDRQLVLFKNKEEQRQYKSNRDYWKRWIANVEDDLEREPARILEFYKVQTYRIEPLGIVYLYPAGGN